MSIGKIAENLVSYDLTLNAHIQHYIQYNILTVKLKSKLSGIIWHPVQTIISGHPVTLIIQSPLTTPHNSPCAPTTPTHIYIFFYFLPDSPHFYYFLTIIYSMYMSFLLVRHIKEKSPLMNNEVFFVIVI